MSGVNLTDTYTTDAYNRILKASESGTSWTQNYLYDAFGNRAVQAGGYKTTSATPTAISQFNAKNQWTSETFDSAGDATSVPGTTTETFSYDGEYRVYQAYALGTINYVYDGEGRRVQKASSVATTNYVYDTNGETVAEYTGQAQPFYGTAYLTEDHLGSTRMETDGAAEVIRRYDYLPFGEEVPAGEGGRGGDYGSATYPTTPDVASRKFTGKERDGETGLDYFGARYFSGPMGRFLSADWAVKAEPVPYASLEDPQTLNLYGYVRNNPLAKADPDGHCPVCLLEEALASPEGEEVEEKVGQVAEPAVAWVATQGEFVFNWWKAAATSAVALVTTSGGSKPTAPQPVNADSKRGLTKDQKASQHDEARPAKKDTDAQASSSGKGGGKKGTRPPNAKHGVDETGDKRESIGAVRALPQTWRAGQNRERDKISTRRKNAIEKARQEHNAGKPNE